MRIRKRQVPLPLSSLSPIPLSDLQVQLLQPRTPPPPDKTPASLAGGPNHQPRLPIGDQSTNDAAALDRSKLLVDCDGVGSEEEQLGDDSSSSAMEESLITGSGLKSSSNQVGGSYHNVERSFPSKKRMGSFEMEEKDKKKKKMKCLKTKVNKKCNGEEDEDYNIGETMIKKEVNGKRKGNRGNVLMEGSRCSRVNGRGWRCCQPTLVGYSLCEHHLGKGRLRSVMNMKRQVPKANKIPSSSQVAKLEPIDEAEDDDGSDEEKVALIMGGAKKMMKIGVVKARSMSSLLSQVDDKNGVCAAEPSDGKESSVDE